MIETLLVIAKVYFGIGLCAAFVSSLLFSYVSNDDYTRELFLMEEDAVCEKRKDQVAARKAHRDIAYGRFNKRVLIYCLMIVIVWPMLFLGK